MQFKSYLVNPMHELSGALAPMRRSFRSIGGNYSDCLSCTGECTTGMCVCKVRKLSYACLCRVTYQTRHDSSFIILCLHLHILSATLRKVWSTGGNCGYIAAFASISYLLFAVATVQLILCMVNDGLKESQLKCKRAFSINTQKCLLGTVMAATGTRAIYFTLQYARIPDEWGDVILTLYYPVLLTGLSMLVSFWAESYYTSVGNFLQCHKYSLALVIFNVLVYLLFVADIIATPILADNEQEQLRKSDIIGSLFAVFFIMVLAGFLHFAIRLFFRPDWQHLDVPKINFRQQFCSCFGVVSHAAMQVFIILFLLFNLVSQFLPVNIESHLAGSLVVRIIELGLPVWFCCSLWNYKHPNNLWILNPQLLLDRVNLGTNTEGRAPDTEETTPLCPSGSTKSYGAFGLENSGDTSSGSSEACWICLDETDKKNLLQFCKCSSVAHQDCLQKWLFRRVSDTDVTEEECLRCQACREKYSSQPDIWVTLSKLAGYKCLLGFSALLVGLALSGLGIAAVVMWVENVTVRYFTVSIIILTDLIFLKCTCYILFRICRSTKFIGLKIIGKPSRDHTSIQILETKSRGHYPCHLHPLPIGPVSQGTACITWLYCVLNIQLSLCMSGLR
ncbi:hypothetical protein EMCRGX_G033994 [Ephydatia muelleri]